MCINLWPHQRQAIAAVHGAIRRGSRSGLVVMPTGAGKTVTFLSLARELGAPALVLAHRDELVRQAADAAAAAWPQATVGVVQGGRDEWQGKDLVVASVLSLHAARLAQVPPAQIRLVVVDEAHHAPAPTWGAALSHLRPDFLLGVTATPDRLDGQGLADWFGAAPLYTYPIQQAVADGVLVPVRQLAVETHVALDGVAVRGGDFAPGELARAVATAARDRVVVEAYRAHAAGRRAIVFAVDRGHVLRLAEALRAAGVAAVGVTGDMPLEQRRQALADFAAGRHAVLVNCEVCTEGYDEPAIECVIMARPTQSRALYQQCVGRGLRICPARGKKYCLVLDMTDNCKKHKLVTAADLFGTPQGPAQPQPARRDPAEDVPVDEFGWPLPPCVPVVWTCEEVPPWPALPSLAGYRAWYAWQHDDATDKQIGALRRFGLAPGRPLTKGEAKHLLDQCVAWSKQEPATPRQVWFLRQRGAWESGLTKEEASRRIAALKGAPVG